MFKSLKKINISFRLWQVEQLAVTNRTDIKSRRIMKETVALLKSLMTYETDTLLLYDSKVSLYHNSFSHFTDTVESAKVGFQYDGLWTGKQLSLMTYPANVWFNGITGDIFKETILTMVNFIEELSNVSSSFSPSRLDSVLRRISLDVVEIARLYVRVLRI